jgi:hypothetical protein
MGTTQTTGSGPGAAGLTGRIIMAADILESQPLEGDKVRVTLRSGEVLIGRKLPDGRIIRGAGVSVPGS